MGLLDSVKVLLGKKQESGNTPNLDNLKDTADNLLDRADDITDKIPGQKDDEIVDQAKEYRNKLG